MASVDEHMKRIWCIYRVERNHDICGKVDTVRGDKSGSEPQVSISSFSMQSLDYGRKDIKGEDYFGKRKGTSGKGAGRMGDGMCIHVYMKM